MARTSPICQTVSRLSLPHPTISPVHLTSTPKAYSLPTMSAIATKSAGHRNKNSSSSSMEIIGVQESLLSNFASLQKPYKSYPLIAWNRHVETIFASFFRSLPDVALRRECLRTRDDGAVALDWVSGDDRRLPSESPVLILLPGLTGGSGDTYVRHMLVRARSKGWRVLVFNSRGCADSPVTTPQGEVLATLHPIDGVDLMSTSGWAPLETYPWKHSKDMYPLGDQPKLDSPK